MSGSYQKRHTSNVRLLSHEVSTNPEKMNPKYGLNRSSQWRSYLVGNKNRQLLRTIIDKKPVSLAELQTLTGRKKSNLSRTLKTLEKFGIVALHKEKNRIVPEVKVTDFQVEFGLNEIAA